MEPQVGVNDSGDAVVVWMQLSGTRNSIWASHYRVASGWNEAGLVETDDSGNAYKPVVGIAVLQNNWGQIKFMGD